MNMVFNSQMKVAIVLIVVLLAAAFYAYSGMLDASARASDMQEQLKGTMSLGLLNELANASLGTISLTAPADCTQPEPRHLNIIAFHPPICDVCEAQSKVLENIAADNPEVSFKKACAAMENKDFLLCSKEYADGANLTDALGYACTVNNTFNASCASEAMIRACEAFGVSSCFDSNLRPEIKQLQQDGKFDIFGKEAQDLALNFNVLDKPAVAFNCNFKKERVFANDALERRVLRAIVNVFVLG